MTFTLISRLASISTVLIMVYMLMNLVEQLEDSGAEVSVSRRPAGDFDALLKVNLDGVQQKFAVEVKSRPPYPNELETFFTMHDHLKRLAAPLLFAPAISEGLGKLLVEHGWSWADSRGNFELRGDGIRLRNRVPTTAPRSPKRSSLPHGSGALKIIRFLIRDRNEWGGLGPTELARIAGVKQPRASQVLKNLESQGLVERVREGWRANRKELLDAFMNQYRGPGGSESYFYSLDPPSDTAAHIVKSVDSSDVEIAISVDVGPDLIVPWRSPTLVIVYVEGVIDRNQLGLVPAHTQGDANVLVRIPDDTSLFRTSDLEAEWRGTPIPLADETQMLWDLHDLGGDDRIEAAGELRKWILQSL